MPIKSETKEQTNADFVETESLETIVNVTEEEHFLTANVENAVPDKDKEDRDDER